jgi:hypothetical protein
MSILLELNKLKSLIESRFKGRLSSNVFMIVMYEKEARLFIPFYEADPLATSMGTIIIPSKEFDFSADQIFKQIDDFAKWKDRK